MKARLINRSGWKILLPKAGNAPLLFLEYIRDCRKAGLKVYPTVTDPASEAEREQYMQIEIFNAIRETNEECVDYINANL